MGSVLIVEGEKSENELPELLEGVEFPEVEVLVFEGTMKSFDEGIFIDRFGHRGLDFLFSEHSEKNLIDVLPSGIGMEDTLAQVVPPSAFESHLERGDDSFLSSKVFAPCDSEAFSAVELDDCGEVKPLSIDGEVGDVTHPDAVNLVDLHAFNPIGESIGSRPCGFVKEHDPAGSEAVLEQDSLGFVPARELGKGPFFGLLPEFKVDHPGAHARMALANAPGLADQFPDQDFFALLLPAMLVESLAADPYGLIECFHTHDSFFGVLVEPFKGRVSEFFSQSMP